MAGTTRADRHTRTLTIHTDEPIDQPGSSPPRRKARTISGIIVRNTLLTMSTCATDMSYLRRKGMQCYGIGPALDVEDGPKGFGAHGDQERILESELHRFVRFKFDAVVGLAGSKD